MQSRPNLSKFKELKCNGFNYACEIIKDPHTKIEADAIPRAAALKSIRDWDKIQSGAGNFHWLLETIASAVEKEMFDSPLLYKENGEWKIYSE